MKKLDNKMCAVFGMTLAGAAFALIAAAQEPSMQSSAADPANTGMGSGPGTNTALGAPPVIPPAPPIRALDVDNHTVVLNKPGIVTLVLCTGEESQDGARKAGNAMYPFQGRLDFQLIVVVDLRDSLANWVPSVAVDQMRSNLDKEAVELKPYFLKNGNTSNPRDSSHVVADFNGAACVQVGWTQSSDDLRGILYGGDGREIKRWNKIDDMDKLQAEVKASLDALVAEKRAHPDADKKKQGEGGTDTIEPPVALPANQDKFPPPGSRRSSDTHSD